MPTEVVINVHFGSFGISREAVFRMAELGNVDAIQELKKNDIEYIEYFNSRYYLFVPDNTPRHDLVLVQTVRELGKMASSKYDQNLEIKTIQGNKYYIKEYDGLENVVEPHDIKWINV